MQPNSLEELRTMLPDDVAALIGDAEALVRQGIRTSLLTGRYGKVVAGKLRVAASNNGGGRYDTGKDQILAQIWGPTLLTELNAKRNVADTDRATGILDEGEMWTRAHNVVNPDPTAVIDDEDDDDDDDDDDEDDEDQEENHNYYDMCCGCCETCERRHTHVDSETREVTPPNGGRSFIYCVDCDHACQPDSNEF